MTNATIIINLFTVTVLTYGLWLLHSITTKIQNNEKTRKARTPKKEKVLHSQQGRNPSLNPTQDELPKQ